MSDFVCQSPDGLFSLWNAIAPWDALLSRCHLGTSQEQRAASAEQTVCRPRCLTTILPAALSAGCHDSMGKSPETKHRSKDIWGHGKWGWEKSLCFTTKTVKLCHPAAAAAQLRVYFKFRLTSKRADNPTVNTADSTDLMYAWPMTACSLSLSQLSLFLSWIIRTPVRPNTDGFMTWWFLATPWVSLSTYLLRSGVGSAFACHLFAFVISSPCAWMYFTAASIEKNNKTMGILENCQARYRNNVLYLSVVLQKKKSFLC